MERSTAGDVHYFFARKSGLGREPGIRQGIDRLGTDGYVIVTPRDHISGKEYRWDEGRELWNVGLAEWPESLTAWLNTGKRTGMRATLAEGEQAEARVEYARNPVSYAAAILAKACKAIVEAPAGYSHYTTMKQARLIGGYVAGEAIDVEEARERLVAAAVERGTSNPERTVEDGLSHGLREPIKVEVAPSALSVVPTGCTSVDPVDPATLLPMLPLKTIEHFCTEGEQGDADLLAHLYKDRLMFAGKTWYAWGCHHWEEMGSERVRLLVTTQVARQYLLANSDLSKQAAEATDKNTQDSLAARASVCLSRARELKSYRRADNVMKLAAGRLALPEGWRWDANPWILPVVNGVVDLKSGELRTGRPEDRVLTYTPTEYRGLTEPAPLWEKTLGEIFSDQPETLGFMHRVLGYGLTGLTTEHILLVLYGENGRNGKDTMLETLHGVLGPAVASPISRDVFLGGSRDHEGSNGAAQPHLMALRGLRYGWCSETGRAGRLNVEQVKRITGGNTIQARALFKGMETFEASHLPILVTNDKPAATASDAALWERLLLVSYNIRFVDEPNGANERPKNVQLKEQLRAETSGILSWLVRGCLEWQQAGLQVPQIVKDATDTYKQEQDLLGQFLNDYAVMEPGAQELSSTIYKGYIAWLRYSLGERYTPTMTAFGKEIKGRFKGKQGRLGKQSGMVYQGVRLSMSPQDLETLFQTGDTFNN